MKIVFDVLVNGEIKETISLQCTRLKEVYIKMTEQIRTLKLKYGSNIIIERRLIY